jgi:uncharacterized membrane protein
MKMSNSNNTKIDSHIIYGVVGFILIATLGLFIYSYLEQKKKKQSSYGRISMMSPCPAGTKSFPGGKCIPEDQIPN